MTAGVLFLPQILATKCFLAPGQTLLTASCSESDSTSRQAWVWLPACSQPCMCSAGWPWDDKPGRQTGQIIVTCCLLHNTCQAASMSQVTKKSMLVVACLLLSPNIPHTCSFPFQHHLQSHRMYTNFFPSLLQPSGASPPLQIREVAPDISISTYRYWYIHKSPNLQGPRHGYYSPRFLPPTHLSASLNCIPTLSPSC